MKRLGNISYVKYELTTPNFSIEVKDMRDINILVGANGTGKTLHLVMIWCINTLVDAKYRYKFKSEFAFKQMCENVFKYAFIDLKLEGSITAKYDEGLDFNIAFTEGKVTSVTITKDNNVLVNTQTQFLSKQTRVFTDINRYYSIKDTICPQDIKFSSFYDPSPELTAVLRMYRIYDILFMEKFKEVMTTKQDIDKDLAETFDGLPKDMKAIQYVGGKLIGFKEDGSEINLETLGAGEQSILVMYLGSRHLK